MNCGAVERWLNEGMPGPGADAMRAHAAGCPLCGPRVAATERVEALLAATAREAPPAPTGFADRVLARIEAEQPLRAPADAAPAPDRKPARPAHPVAWWIRAGADPAIPLAIAFAMVFLGVAQAAMLLAGRAIAFPLPTLDWSAPRGALGGTPFTQAVVALCALALVLLASHRLFHATQRSVRLPGRRW